MWGGERAGFIRNKPRRTRNSPRCTRNNCFGCFGLGGSQASPSSRSTAACRCAAELACNTDFAYARIHVLSAQASHSGIRGATCYIAGAIATVLSAKTSRCGIGEEGGREEGREGAIRLNALKHTMSMPIVVRTCEVHLISTVLIQLHLTRLFVPT